MSSATPWSASKASVGEVYSPKIPENVFRALDRAIAEEQAATGLTAYEVINSGRAEQISRVALSELVPEPATARQKFEARHFLGVAIGNRQTKR